MSDWLKALQAAGLEEVESAADAMDVPGWLDTGNYALNWAISGRLRGGYPMGRTTVIFGDPSTGKSTLVARAIASAQQAGGVAMLDDVEGGYSVEHTARMGVDVDKLAWRNSHTVDEHLDTAKAFLAAFRAHQAKLPEGAPGVLALDSIAQLSTKHELEVGLAKKDMTRAGELKTFFRIIGPELYRLPVVHLSTNHTIAAIGNRFQSRTTPGGGGPKFSASVMVDLRAVSKIKTGNGDYSGVICHAVIAKNRFTSPWKEVHLAIPFEGVPSPASGLLPLLMEKGVLEARGQFLYLGDEKVGRALKSKEKFLEQDAQAEELLDGYEDLLDWADERLSAHVGAVEEEEFEGDAEEEAEEEE